MEKWLSPPAKKLLFWSTLVTILVVVCVLAFSVVAPMVYFYTAHNYIRAQMESEVREARERSRLNEEAQRNAAAVVISGPTTAPAPPPPSEVLVDGAGDGTANNYLARVITQDIERQARFGIHPDEAMPSILVNTLVNCDPPFSTQIRLLNWPKTSELEVTLNPSFAWDAHEYAKLAEAIFKENLPQPAPTSSGGDADKLLEDLLEPTGRKLAMEDVRLSTQLQKMPLDVQAQEDAALLLVTMALRETFADSRLLLCRATAHLALADALQSGTPSWTNRVADVAIRVIAGREVESLQMLEDMGSAPDCPPAVKSWISTLKIWAKFDARGIEVTTTSPRLLKIAWFDALTLNIPILSAISQLETLGTPDNTPDWTRAICSAQATVETGHRFAAASIQLEEQEMNEVLEAEGAPKMNDAHLDIFYSEPETETVSADASGHPLIHVLGVGTFKFAARQHIFNSLRYTYYWLANRWGVPEVAKSFAGQVEALYQGVPFFETVEYNLDAQAQKSPLIPILDRVRAKNKVWDISKLDPSNALFDSYSDPIAKRLASAYFQDGPPIGSTYNIAGVIYALNMMKLGANWHGLPTEVDPKLNTKLRFFQKLQEMNPSSLALTEEIIREQPQVTGDYAMANISRFLDYNVHAYEFLDRDFPFDLMFTVFKWLFPAFS